MTAITRHGLRATDLDAIYRAREILDCRSLQIEMAIAENFDVPSSLKEVISALDLMLNADLIPTTEATP